MNKSDLAATVAEHFDLTKKTSGEILNHILETITKALKKGETVSFIGFGNFSVKTRNARKGRNPASGEVIKIPSMKVPHFKAGTELKTAVRGKKKK